MNRFAKLSPTYTLLIQKNYPHHTTKLSYKVTLANKQQFFLHTITVHKNNFSTISRIIREYHILRNVQSLGCRIARAVDLEWVQDDKEDYIRFELLIEKPGVILTKKSYREMVNKHGSIELPYQLACTLASLEKVGVSHLSVRTDSILLDKEMNVVLTNFSNAISFFYNPTQIAECLQDNDYHKSITTKLSKINIPQKCDVFSFAMTWYECLTWENNLESTGKKDVNFIKKVKQDLKKCNMKEYTFLFEHCLNSSSTKTITFGEIVKTLEKLLNIVNSSKIKLEDLREKARIHKKCKEFEAWVWNYENMLKNNVIEESMYGEVANAFLKTGRYKKCITYIKSCLEKLPSESERSFLLNIKLAKAYIAEGCFKDARNVIIKFWNDENNKIYKYIRVNGLLCESEREYNVAIDGFYKKAFCLKKSKDKKLNNITKDIIRVLIKSGETNIASYILNKDRGNEWDSLLYKGMIKVENKCYDEALDFFNESKCKFIKLYGEDHPSMLRILLPLADVLITLSKDKLGLEVVEVAEQLVKAKFDNEHYNNCLIDLLYAKLAIQKCNYQKALKYAIHAKTIKQTHYLLETHLIIAECYIRLGKFQEGIKVLEDFYEVLPDLYHFINIKINCLLGEANILNDDIDKGLDYLKKAEDLSIRIENNKYLYEIYSNAIRGLVVNENYEMAFHCVDRLIELGDKVGSEIALGQIYNARCIPELSFLYFYKAKTLYKRQLVSRYKYYELLKMLGTAAKSAKFNNFAAFIYSEMNKNLQGSGILMEAEILNEIGKTKVCLIRSSGESQDLCKEALSYYKKALEVYHKLDNDKGKVITLICKSEVYKKLEKYKDAINELKKAEELAKDNSKLKSQIYLNLGIIWDKKHDINNALEYYTNAKKLLSKPVTNLNEKQLLVSIHINIAKLMLVKKKFEEAAIYLAEAFEYSNNVRTLMKIYKLLLDKNIEETIIEKIRLESKYKFLQENIEKRKKVYEILKEKTKLIGKEITSKELC